MDFSVTWRFRWTWQWVIWWTGWLVRYFGGRARDRVKGRGGGVVLSPVSVFTSSEAPFLPLSDSAENSFCCPFSRRSHFFGGIRVCLNESVAWNSPPPILLITQQQGRTEHLIGFDWPMITLFTKHSELFGSFALLNKTTKVYRYVRGVLSSLSFYFNTRFVNTKGEFSLRHLFTLRRTVYKNNGTFSSPMRVWRMAHVLPNHCERSKALRLSCRGLAGRGFESRWRHIFSFWIFRSLPVPNRSTEPLQMKSSMSNHLKS